MTNKASAVSSIVVGVDGSDGSRRAAEFARDVAGAFQARLTLVLAVEPLPDATVAELGLAPEQLRTRQLAAGQHALDEMCRELMLAHAEQVLVLGRAPEAICAEAEDRHADVIVVGARGHGSYRMMTGSVGARLMNIANRTVTVVR